ncbi:MAG: hypothetical protein ISS69_17910 [Phycisphaerae bacterium]|nr:hypothetical protein [Planctomycetota bacterium]MBL7221988.1 hypothetical protein [Phycisphaerae bacterium]
MFRKRETLLIIPVLILSVLPLPVARAADALPARHELVPAGAVIVLNFSEPKAAFDLILRPKLIEAVESSPLYKAQVANKGFRQFRSLVRLLERRLETDWKSIVRRLGGGGATWAVGPGKSNLFIIDALDTKVLKEAHDLLLFLVESEAEKKGLPSRAGSTKYAGVTCWSLGPNEAHTIVGRRLMIANSPNILKAALDLRAKTGGKSIASLPAYQQAIKAAPSDAAATVYANTTVLKQIPPVAKALAGQNNPLIALLAAPITEALSNSTWLNISLTIKNDTLTLDAVSDGTLASTGAARFALPAKTSDGAMPNLKVPRRIAAMSLHRDLKGFYAAKDKLFGERTSGLIFFENMMGIFFTGRDLTQEVLAETGPKIRIVVAEQKYDPAAGKPSIRFPAFALVLPLKNPKKFSPVMEEAWQKAIGLVNFTRGQNAQPGLIIDRPVYRKTKYTVAAFTPPADDAPKDVDVRFNFRPTLAMTGNHVIFSSTDSLAKDIIDALAKEADRPTKPLAGMHSMLEMNGAQLDSIMEANRKNLVRQNMVEKGHTQQQAESEMDLLSAAIRTVSRVVLNIGTGKGRSKMSLEVHLNLPPAGSGEK